MHKWLIQLWENGCFDYCKFAAVLKVHTNSVKVIKQSAVLWDKDCNKIDLDLFDFTSDFIVSGRVSLFTIWMEVGAWA